MSDRFQRHDRVRITEGLSKGLAGTVLEFNGISPDGSPFWLVSVDRSRIRSIKESWLECIEPAASVRCNICKRPFPPGLPEYTMHCRCDGSFVVTPPQA